MPSDDDDLSIFDVLGIDPRHRAQLVMRPMTPVLGVARTLVMGIVLGDFCPDRVDRRVDAVLTIQITAAERARGRGSPGGGFPGYVTDDWPHGSLIDSSIALDPKLWESEPGFERPVRARTAAERRRDARAVKHPSWRRVVFVDGRGYDCDQEATGRDWSDKQKHAATRTAAEAQDVAKVFRSDGFEATVIRVRPRAS